MAKVNINDDLSELECSVSALILEERKKQALQEIEELRLENELAELEETKRQLLLQREWRAKGTVKLNDYHEAGWSKDTSTSNKIGFEQPLEGAGNDYSTYGFSRR